MTGARKRGSANYIPGLEEGHWYNIVTNEILGETLTVIPIVGYRSQIMFNPMDEGGGIACRSFNGRDGGQLCPVCQDCPNYLWRIEADGARKPPLCTTFYNYVCFVLPENSMAVISFKSSGVGFAMQWNARMRMQHDAAGRPLPMYARVWKLHAVPQKNSKFEWFTAAIECIGTTPDNVFRDALGAAPGILDLVRRKPLVKDTDVEKEILEQVAAEEAAEQKGGGKEVPV
jgi:hypothetical protein